MKKTKKTSEEQRHRAYRQAARDVMQHLMRHTHYRFLRKSDFGTTSNEDLPDDVFGLWHTGLAVSFADLMTDERLSGSWLPSNPEIDGLLDYVQCPLWAMEMLKAVIRDGVGKLLDRFWLAVEIVAQRRLDSPELAKGVQLRVVEDAIERVHMTIAWTAAGAAVALHVQGIAVTHVTWVLPIRSDGDTRAYSVDDAPYRDVVQAIARRDQTGRSATSDADSARILAELDRVIDVYENGAAAEPDLMHLYWMLERKVDRIVGELDETTRERYWCWFKAQLVSILVSELVLSHHMGIDRKNHVGRADALLEMAAAAQSEPELQLGFAQALEEATLLDELYAPAITAVFHALMEAAYLDSKAFSQIVNSAMPEIDRPAA